MSLKRTHAQASAGEARTHRDKHHFNALSSFFHGVSLFRYCGVRGRLKTPGCLEDGGVKGAPQTIALEF